MCYIKKNMDSACFFSTNKDSFLKSKSKRCPSKKRKNSDFLTFIILTKYFFVSLQRIFKKLAING